jgi:putative sigma-54 modulation protein
MVAKIDIIGKNMEVTDRIEEYVQKKVGKFDRLISELEDVRIDLGHSKSARSASDRHVAQITLRGRGFILRTEERGDDLFAAFDSSMDKMQRQIERYKGKKSKVRGDGKSTADVSPEPVVMDEREASVVVKRKTFHLVPMDEMEALEQMNLLGHEDFFVFYNVDNNSINVLYRRRDGSYGVIIPEIA